MSPAELTTPECAASAAEVYRERFQRTMPDGPRTRTMRIAQLGLMAIAAIAVCGLAIAAARDEHSVAAAAGIVAVALALVGWLRVLVVRDRRAAIATQSFWESYAHARTWEVLENPRSLPLARVDRGPSTARRAALQPWRALSGEIDGIPAQLLTVAPGGADAPIEVPAVRMTLPAAVGVVFQHTRTEDVTVREVLGSDLGAVVARQPALSIAQEGQDLFVCLDEVPTRDRLDALCATAGRLWHAFEVAIR